MSSDSDGERDSPRLAYDGADFRRGIAQFGDADFDKHDQRWTHRIALDCSGQNTSFVSGYHQGVKGLGGISL